MDDIVALLTSFQHMMGLTLICACLAKCMIQIRISEDNQIKCDLDRRRSAKGEDKGGDHVDTGCDEEEPPPF